MLIAKVLEATPQNLALAAHALQNDEVIGMPTETVYGLAASCWSIAALAEVFRVKGRPTSDPLIVHVNLKEKTLAELEALSLIDLSQIPKTSQIILHRLMAELWPGPLTLVLPKHARVPHLITSGLSTVAIRMPRHPLARELITLAKTPLAAPSANRFGRISPTTAQAVLEELGDQIHLILDGGPSEIGLESTVIALKSTGDLVILRPGGTSIERIEQLAGKSLLSPEIPSPNLPASGMASPGMLESHYAPKKPFYLLANSVSRLTLEDLKTIKAVIHSYFSQQIQMNKKNAFVGLLAFSGDPETQSKTFSQQIGFPVLIKVLSSQGNLEEAAHQLFSEMRWLDSSPVDLIFSEPSPLLEGLGLAIADRLKRAAAQK